MSANSTQAYSRTRTPLGRTLEQTPPRQRPRTLSPREYSARLDLCRLWDLMCERKRPAEIAQLMCKDPAWVSRSIQRIHEDFSTVYTNERQREIVAKNLSHFESLYAKALTLSSQGSCRERTAALKTALDVLRAKAEYEVTVGNVKGDSKLSISVNAPFDVAEMRQEIPDLSLLRILEAVTNRQNAQTGGGSCGGTLAA